MPSIPKRLTSITRKTSKKANAEYSKAANEYNKKTLGGLAYNRQAYNKLLSSAKKVGYAKEDLSDAKAKLKIPTNKSKRELALEKEYQSKGYSAEEAELAAYKRAKAEKVLKIVAAGALAAGVAAVTAASGMKVISSKRESEIVAEYKREHPGTKLSAKEIIRNHKEIL